MTATDGPQSRSANIVYDAGGNVAEVIAAPGTPNARKTSFTYDAADRPQTQTLPDGRQIAYTYDQNGNLTSLTPPGRPAHGFAYDRIDQTTEYAPPVLPAVAQPRTRYEYNLDRQMTKIVRPDGQSVAFNYNAQSGRLDSLTLPNGSQAYAYDANTGKLKTLTSVSGDALNYAWDGSLLLSETASGAVSGGVSFGYNNDFNLTNEAAGAGAFSHAVSYAYDNDGLLTQAGDLTLSHDAQNGLLAGTQLGSLTTARGHNAFGELSSESADYSGNPLYSATYQRDDLGRIIQKTETLEGVEASYVYTYDLAGRLAQVEKDGAVVETYVFDANGNRTNENAQYDAQDRLLQYAGETYAYTENGELKSKGNALYHYDVMGNLSKVEQPGKVIEYLTDARNRRIGKKVDGVLVQGFVYRSQLQPALELDSNGEVVARFVYATKANVPEYVLKNGKTYRIITDHLGSPRLVVDVADGSVAQRMDYDAFGNVLYDTNPGFQPFGFAGGLYDRDTGLVRFGARDYDARTGRWTAKDPIRFAGGDTNLYGYVLGEPVNWVDPYGFTNLEIYEAFEFIREVRLDVDVPYNYSIDSLVGDDGKFYSGTTDVETGEITISKVYSGEKYDSDDALARNSDILRIVMHEMLHYNDPVELRRESIPREHPRHVQIYDEGKRFGSKYAEIFYKKIRMEMKKCK